MANEKNVHKIPLRRDVRTPLPFRILLLFKNSVGVCSVTTDFSALNGRGEGAFEGAFERPNSLDNCARGTINSEQFSC